MTATARSSFGREQAREYFRQLCLGLEYLHHNEVVHRDVSPLHSDTIIQTLWHPLAIHSEMLPPLSGMGIVTGVVGNGGGID